jgi:ligand-binding sensor domain-containing protein
VYNKLLILVCLVISNKSLHAQNLTNSVTWFNKNDGLPSNIVYSIAKDKNEVLWIGTDAGLVQFDGNNFKTFTTSDELPSNDIFFLFCDSKNRLWLRTMSKEIVYFQNGKVHHKGNDSVLKKVNLKSGVESIREDLQGNIYLLSNKEDVIKISNNRVSYYKVHKFKLENIQNYDLEFLITGQYDSIESGLGLTPRNRVIAESILLHDNYIWIIENGETKKLPYTKEYLHQYCWNWSYWFLKKINNQIVRLTNNGIIIYKDNNLQKPETYLEGNVISDAIFDKNNNLWVTTLDKGLYKVNLNKNSYNLPASIEAPNNYFSVFLKENIICLGDNLGYLHCLKKSNLTLLYQKKLIEKNIHNNRVLGIKSFDKTNLIVGLDKGLVKYNVNSGNCSEINSNSGFKGIALLGDTIIGLGTAELLVMNRVTSDMQFSFHNKRHYSAINYNGNMLIGAEDGLFIYKSGQLLPYALSEKLNNRIMDMTILDSILVLATIDKGIYFINRHEIVKKLQIQDGLSSNNCFKIKNSNGKLYIATDFGFNIYDTKTNTFQKYFESDGLASNRIQDFALDSNILYTVGDKGLNVIDLKTQKPKNDLSIYISNIYNNNDTHWSNFNLNNVRTGRDVIINLIALSYNVKGKINYYYRIKEMDSQFSKTSNQDIHLHFNKHGNYILEIFAIDANANKSNIIIKKIHVSPFFWQTILFKVLVLLTSLVLIFYFIKKRELKINTSAVEKQKNAKRLHELELAVWRSKINPHFLFNSLSSIASIIKMNQNNKAVEYIHSFSYILRRTIQNSKKTLITIGDEIKYIEEYLKMETLKREGNFNYIISGATDEIKTYYMPSLILQPVIENSLKHGIKARLDGCIKIHFDVIKDKLVCKVSDNGKCMKNYDKPIYEGEHQSIGIELVYKKIKIIEEIYNIYIEFEYEYADKINKVGVTSIFTLPIILKDFLDEGHTN